MERWTLSQGKRRIPLAINARKSVVNENNAVVLLVDSTEDDERQYRTIETTTIRTPGRSTLGNVSLDRGNTTYYVYIVD